MNKYNKKFTNKRKIKFHLEYMVNDSISSSKGFFNLFFNNIKTTYKDD